MKNKKTRKGEKMERYERLVCIYIYTSNSIEIKEGGNTFISDNKKQADYI